MSDVPLVSVVVNNYNYGRFLREAIDSALNQTYPGTEVVVVDDGSTDDSRRIISSYGDRVTPVLKENGGQASAFNAGFAASRGEVVIFLDADDYLWPGAAERVAAAWGPDVSVVQYRLELVDAMGNPTGHFYPPPEMTMASGEVWRVLLEKGYYLFPPTSGNGFVREVLEQILPMPEDEWRISADGYLATLAPFYGLVASVEVALGAQRMHGGNLFSLTAINSEKFRAVVRQQLQEQALLVCKANELGYETTRDLSLSNYVHLQHRMSSLRLNPQKHLVPSDHSLSLVYRGVRAVWRHSEHDWRKRLLLSAWFIWVGLLPLPVAKLAIAWLFTPEARPRIVEWIRDTIRSL
jgi:glycosyltransferase involved in cell wall biosynthesis